MVASLHESKHLFSMEESKSSANTITVEQKEKSLQIVFKLFKYSVDRHPKKKIIENNLPCILLKSDIKNSMIKQYN